MNKRLVIKTAVICTGLFLMLLSLVIFWLSRNYRLDMEKWHPVLVAGADIREGTVIRDSMVAVKQIRVSAWNEHMMDNMEVVIGSRALQPVRQGDYIRSYSLVPKGQLYSEEDRILVLPMDIEDRLGNLVRRGSYIDIKVLPREGSFLPQIVLSRVRVEDILGENGGSLEEGTAARKAYAKMILGKVQRDRLYAALQAGKLSYELYCDPSQRPAAEEFRVPGS